MLTIEEFKRGEIAIECNSFEEAKALWLQLVDHNICWNGGKSLESDAYPLNWLKEHTISKCYRFKSESQNSRQGLVYGVREIYKKEPHLQHVKVVSFNEIFNIKIDAADLAAILLQ